jgi:hypothetical protein
MLKFRVLTNLIFNGHEYSIGDMLSISRKNEFFAQIPFYVRNGYLKPIEAEPKKKRKVKKVKRLSKLEFITKC